MKDGKIFMPVIGRGTPAACSKLQGGHKDRNCVEIQPGSLHGVEASRWVHERLSIINAAEKQPSSPLQAGHSPARIPPQKMPQT